MHSFCKCWFNAARQLATFTGVALVLSGCSTPETAACAEGSFDGEKCAGSGCPDGETRRGGQCVPNDATAPSSISNPPGGAFAGDVSVTIAADEPATIYYTTDGSDPSTSSTSGESPVVLTLTEAGDLKFFAVDAVGNEESVNTQTFDIDADAPGAITNLTAMLNVSDVDLTWSNPNTADFDTVLVVRSPGVAVSGFTPDVEADYAVGDVVSPNVTVVYQGAAQSFTDSDPVSGDNHYAAYARDTRGNHAAPATASASGVPFDQGQLATLEVDLVTKVVTVTQQPKDILITPQGGQFGDGGNSATLRLDVTSRSGQTLTQVKFVVDDVVGATAVGNSVVGGEPAINFGAALLEGGTASGNLGLTGVGATDPVVVTVSIFSDPLLVGAGIRRDPDAGYHFFDPRSGAALGIPCPVPSKTNGGRCGYAGFAQAPNSTKFYAGVRMAANVVAIDPVADQFMVSADLTDSQAASVPGLALTPAGRVVALLNDGQQWKSTASGGSDWNFTGVTVEVVQLDGDDLSELSRFTLVTSATIPYSGRGISVDSTGTFAAAIVQGGSSTSCDRRVYRVNLTTNQVTDTLCPQGTARVSNVAISPNGDDVYVGYRSSTGAEFLTRWSPPSAAVEIPLPTTGTSPRIGKMKFAADGRLYISMRSSDPRGLYAFDPTNNSFDQISTQATMSSGLSPDGLQAFTIDRESPPNLRIFNVSTGEVQSTVTLGVSNLSRGHHTGAWLTP